MRIDGLRWTGGKWWVKATDDLWGSYIGVVPLVGVHPRNTCRAAGFPCVIHKPSKHGMREFPLLWRGDKSMFERTCPHGVGHPDPDDLAYHERQGRTVVYHGCCGYGCCTPGEKA